MCPYSTGKYVEWGRGRGNKGTKGTHQKLVANLKPRLPNITHGVLERPHNRVHNELELGRGEAEESREAKLVDGPNKLEEGHPVLGELGKVLADHRQSGLKDGIQNGGDHVEEELFQLRDDGRGGAQDLCIAGEVDALLVISENSIKEGRDKAVENHLVVFALGHKGFHQLQDFLLDGPHAANKRGLGGDRTLGNYGSGDHLADNLVQGQHVHVDPPDLSQEGVPDGRARRHVGLQDIGEVLHLVQIFQSVRALACLANDRIPLG